MNLNCTFEIFTWENYMHFHLFLSFYMASENIVYWTKYLFYGAFYYFYNAFWILTASGHFKLSLYGKKEYKHAAYTLLLWLTHILKTCLDFINNVCLGYINIIFIKIALKL